MIRTAILTVALAACATNQSIVPPEQRASLKRSLEGQDRYLKLSFYATPFFGDSTKRLLTPVPPDQVRLLEETDGTPINPGAIEATFPAGTEVRIRALDFPTAIAQTERVLVTPRTQP